MRSRPSVAIAVAALALAATVAPIATGYPGPTGPAHVAATAVRSDAIVPVATAGWQAVPSTDPVRISLTLAFNDSARLNGLLENLTDPRSSEYRAFLTRGQFLHRFGPSAGEVARAEEALARAGGYGIAVSPGALGVAGVVPAGRVDTWLGVSLVERPGAPGLYASHGPPRLPAGLAGVVTGIGGLSNAGAPSSSLLSVVQPPVAVDQFVTAQPSGDQWDVGSDFAQALGATDLWPTGPHPVGGATYPTGIAVATLLSSAYNTTYGANLPAYDPAVVGAYFNDTLGPGWPRPNLTGVPVGLPGVGAPPSPGSFGSTNDSSEDESENSLDVEMAGSLAPGSAVYTFYFAESAIAAPTVPLGDAADDFAWDLAAALNESYGPAHRLAVVSGSFGLPEYDDALWDSGLIEAAALGVTVVCASGDQGDAPGPLTDRGPATPLWPATATFDNAGAVSVGGASMTLLGSATSNATPTHVVPAFDPEVAGVGNASVWYESLSNGLLAGSEGGVSGLFPEPTWQFDSAAQPAIVNATILEGQGVLGRAGPDLALPANNTIVFVFANATGTVFLEVVGGTSVAAPILAGLVADIVAVNSARAGAFAPLGFVDPALYRIASYYASAAVRASAGEASDPFRDIVLGGNYLYRALPGWDAATGWGWVEVPALLAALDNATVAGYAYTGPTPGLPSAPAAPFVSVTDEYLLIGVGATVAVALVLLAAAPSRPRPPPARTPPPSPVGSALPIAAAAGTSPAATFACPYCGAERPAEPVRCPRCGRL